MPPRLAVLWWGGLTLLYRILPRRCRVEPIEMDATYSRICDRLEDALRRVR